LDVLAQGGVAPRRGQAPRAYSHFPEKLDLLGAVAAVGFDRLNDGLARATAGIDDPEALFVVICRTYVRLGLGKPAYRFMFGPVLSDTGASNRRPSPERLATGRELCWKTPSCAAHAPVSLPSRPAAHTT
jgi:hypothetical protein